MSAVIIPRKISDAERAEADAKEAARPPDGQDKERAAKFGQLASSLQAENNKLISSNERLTTLVGKLYDELAALKEEQVAVTRSEAYALVQRDWEYKSIVGANQMCTGEWRALTENPDGGPTCGSLIEAVDAAKAGE